jgi:hypothetical protein
MYQPRTSTLLSGSGRNGVGRTLPDKQDHARIPMEAEMIDATATKVKPVRKRLVVCCDGTWNTPDERSERVRAPTNVSKVMKHFTPPHKSRHDQYTRTVWETGSGCTLICE